MSPISPPDAIADLASACVGAVEAAVGMTLDGTQDTLPVLDHFLSLVPERTRSEIMSLVGPMVGAYFGEVIRHHLPGARWHLVSESPGEWRIEFEPCFLHFNPVGMALEAILHGSSEDVPAHLSMLDRDRDAVDTALTNLGSVSEEDYYRLSVRYEVIETAHHVLTMRAGRGDEIFGPDAYEAVIEGRARGPLH